jgi:hypothetical protein
MNYNRNPIRMEREQKRIDAGIMAAQYPEVLNIIVNMIYSQKGIRNKLIRTMHYSPNSYAFFYVDCLNKECNDGGFDFNQVIKSMIRNHREIASGKLDCESSNLSSNHSDIVYEVSIKYA